MQILWGLHHASPAVSVDWGNEAIVSLDMNGTVYVWSATGPKEKKNFKTRVVNPHVIKLSPSGGLLAVGGSAVEVYSLSGVLIYRYKNSSTTNDLAWTSDGRIVAVQNKGILILDPATKEVKEAPNRRGCAFTSLALSPDGKRFATGTCDGKVDVWFSDTLLPYKTFSFNSSVVDICWTEDGSTLIVATAEGIYFYSTESWKRVDSLSYGAYSIKFISASFDGNFVIYGGEDKVPRLYNRRKRKVYEGPRLTHWIMDGDWEEAGFRFVVVSADGDGVVFAVNHLP